MTLLQNTQQSRWKEKILLFCVRIGTKSRNSQASSTLWLQNFRCSPTSRRDSDILCQHLRFSHSNAPITVSKLHGRRREWRRNNFGTTICAHGGHFVIDVTASLRFTLTFHIYREHCLRTKLQDPIIIFGNTRVEITISNCWIWPFTMWHISTVFYYVPSKLLAPEDFLIWWCHPLDTSAMRVASYGLKTKIFIF